jgi:hypothetical protein
MSDLTVKMKKCWPTERHIYDTAQYKECPYCKHDKTAMSDTPEVPTPMTDAAEIKQERLDGDIDAMVCSEFARKLERELARMREELEQFQYATALGADLIVLLDVEVESLPENEYKIYEEAYDKTLEEFTQAIRALSTESAAKGTDNV